MTLKPLKEHQLKDSELVSKAFNILPPSILYRKGKYVKILTEFDGFVWHGVIDYRKYKRLLNKVR